MPGVDLCATGVERRGVGSELRGKERPHARLEPCRTVLERARLAQQRAEVAPGAKLGHVLENTGDGRGVAAVQREEHAVEELALALAPAAPARVEREH